MAGEGERSIQRVRELWVVGWREEQDPAGIDDECVFGEERQELVPALVVEERDERGLPPQHHGLIERLIEGVEGGCRERVVRRGEPACSWHREEARVGTFGGSR